MDIKKINQDTIEEFRANGGKVGGMFDGVPLLLLTTTGAKSGAKRVNPLAFFQDGERYIIIASYAGGPNNPPWYYNLLAHPEVGVEVGDQNFRANTEVLAEPDRTQMYERMAALLPQFNEYRENTDRVIPVIALHPVA